MYYIYHIPNIKIGCTTNPKRRIFKQQRFDNYEILEIHNQIDIASKREKELQNEYGYQIENTSYEQIIQIRCNTDELYNGNKKRGLEKVKNGKWSDITQKANEITSKSILCFEYKSKKFISEFKSLSEASRQLNLKSIGNISMVLNNKRNHTGGFYFEYK